MDTPPEVATGSQPRETGRAVEPRLKGHLGVVALVFTVLAFNAPLGVAAGFVPVVIGYGNQTGAPLTFIAIGVLLTLFAVGLTAMSKYMNSPGAFYSYVVAGMGRVTGLGAAFLAFAAYWAFAICSTAFGGIALNALVVGTFNGPDIKWYVWAAVMWLATSGLSLLNIDLSAKVLGVAMSLEVAIVAVWAARVFFTGGAQGVSSEPLQLSSFSQGSISFALLFGVLCITGFEAVAVFREETKDPVKTVPRATYTAIFFLCTFYALTAWAFLTAYGDEAVAATADPSGSFVASVDQYVGVFAKDLVSVLLVSSIFASVLANQNIGARYLYTLGKDNVLPRSLGSVHPTQGSPFIAARVFAVMLFVGLAIPAICQVDPLQIYTSFAGFGGVCLVVLLTLTCVSVVAFFRRDDEHQANLWQAVVAPVLATAGLGTLIVLAVQNMSAVIGGSQTLANIAIASIVGFVVAGAALATYYRRTDPEIYHRIGHQDL